MTINEKEFTFKKFQGAEKNKQWNWDMTFALQDVKLWDYIIGTAKRSPELKETEKNDEDRKERIYQRWEKIQDLDLDVQKTDVKISRMYIDTVIQKEFLAVKTSTEWDPKEF